MTVIFRICAWLIFLWKYTTCFKPVHIFLASELIKNLRVATFASMLMKSIGFPHEAARCPFLYASISLAYLEAEKGHAYKKSIYGIHHWRNPKSSYKKLTWVRLNPRPLNSVQMLLPTQLQLVQFALTANFQIGYIFI